MASYSTATLHSRCGRNFDDVREIVSIAWKPVRSLHAHISPSIQLEEEINYTLTDLNDSAKEHIGKLLAKPRPR
jgi:hypothetical protein